MTISDTSDLFDHVSPSYYREFRLLYNELLGYLERKEFDKIEQFSHRLNTTLGDAHAAQMALYKRLQQYRRESAGGYQKMVRHQRFRQPPETIPITHPFPLKHSVPAISDVPCPDPLPTSQPIKPRLDTLMADMAAHDDAQRGILDDQVMVDEPSVSATMDAAISGPAGTTIIAEAPSSEPVDDSGVSLKEDVTDASVYFRETPANDIQRAETARDPSLKKTDTQSNRNKDSLSKDSANDRKKRVWDYIDNDGVSGRINHDL
jgi:hypothetical protein